MNKRELRKHFSYKTRRKLNVTKLVKNLVWQAYTWIKSGKMEPFYYRNLRSFWYSNVKSVLSRLDLEVSGRKYTEKVYDTFVEMITVHHLFRYVDFGFSDGRKGMRTIGSTNGNLILFVEKDGLFDIIKKLALFYKATGISLKGFPSYLTCEYLVREMAKKGLLREPVHLFSMVDYDPGGYWIEKEFVKQLKDYNVEVGSVHSLITPAGLSKEKIEINKFKLKTSARTRNWMEITGGINNEEYGLEVDAFGARWIKETYEREIESYLEKSLQVFVDEEKEKYFQALAKDPALFKHF